jgi:hypothetical protein
VGLLVGACETGFGDCVWLAVVGKSVGLAVVGDSEGPSDGGIVEVGTVGLLVGALEGRLEGSVGAKEGAEDSEEGAPIEGLDVMGTTLGA